jgi:hypothetical protein
MDFELMLLWCDPPFVHKLVANQSFQVGRHSLSSQSCHTSVWLILLRVVSLELCLEPVVNYSHRFWFSKPRNKFVVLQSCHSFTLRAVAMLRCSESEQMYMAVDLLQKCFSMSQVILLFCITLFYFINFLHYLPLVVIIFLDLNWVKCQKLFVHCDECKVWLPSNFNTDMYIPVSHVVL